MVNSFSLTLRLPGLRNTLPQTFAILHRTYARMFDFQGLKLG